MLRKCRENIGATNLSLQKTDGFTLKEFAGSSVDLVFSHDVFVHFSSLQVFPYLLEIKRVLRDGGTGIVSFYNFAVHFNYFKETSREFASRRVFPPHMRVHFTTEEMLRLMLEDVGLEILEVDKTNYLVVVFRR